MVYEMFDDCTMTVRYTSGFVPEVEIAGDNAEIHCKEGMIQLRKSPTGLFIREEPCLYHVSRMGEQRCPQLFYCGLFQCPLNGETTQARRPILVVP